MKKLILTLAVTLTAKVTMAAPATMFLCKDKKTNSELLIDFSVWTQDDDGKGFYGIQQVAFDELYHGGEHKLRIFPLGEANNDSNGSTHDDGETDFVTQGMPYVGGNTLAKFLLSWDGAQNSYSFTWTSTDSKTSMKGSCVTDYQNYQAFEKSDLVNSYFNQFSESN